MHDRCDMNNEEKTAANKRGRLTRAFVNAVTDTPALFSYGSAIMTLPVSKMASVFNLVRGGVLSSTRLFTELESEGFKLPLPKLCRDFVKNKGASFYMSSLITSFAAASVAIQSDLEQVKNAIQFSALSFFASSTFLIGTGLSSSSEKTRLITSSLGMALGNVGLCLAAGPDATPLTYAFYASSAAASLHLAKHIRPANGMLQPEFLSALGNSHAAYKAYENENAFYAATNVIFALGYLSLDRTKKYGGVSQWIEKKISKIKDSSPDRHL